MFEKITNLSKDMRNVLLLAVTQAISGSNQAVVIAIGALTAITIAPEPNLVTIPTTAMILGLALMAGPAAMLLHRLGRKRGFILGGMLAVVGGIVACLSVVTQNFWTFCIGFAFIGTSASFGQQYRFAIADSVEPSFKAKAISYVMAGGILAGFLGPRLASETRNLIPNAEYAASYLTVSVLAILAIFTLMFTKLTNTENAAGETPESGRSTRALLASPSIFVPIITGISSYGLMTFVMVAAPIAMVHICGLPVDDAANAIQWHIVSMFAPSFITPMIIKRLGSHMTAGLGMVLFLLCAIVNLHGITTTHFVIAMIFLGVGWNFGFIGATNMLTSAYSKTEAARVQGLNDQLVFGVMALSSLGSGVVLNLIGWQAVNILAIPLATATIALLGWSELTQNKKRAQ